MHSNGEPWVLETSKQKQNRNPLFCGFRTNQMKRKNNHQYNIVRIHRKTGNAASRSRVQLSFPSSIQFVLQWKENLPHLTRNSKIAQQRNRNKEKKKCSVKLFLASIMPSKYSHSTSKSHWNRWPAPAASNIKHSSTESSKLATNFLGIIFLTTQLLYASQPLPSIVCTDSQPWRTWTIITFAFEYKHMPHRDRQPLKHWETLLLLSRPDRQPGPSISGRLDRVVRGTCLESVRDDSRR